MRILKIIRMNKMLVYSFFSSYVHRSFSSSQRYFERESEYSVLFKSRKNDHHDHQQEQEQQYQHKHWLLLLPLLLLSSLLVGVVKHNSKNNNTSNRETYNNESGCNNNGNNFNVKLYWVMWMLSNSTLVKPERKKRRKHSHSLRYKKVFLPQKLPPKDIAGWCCLEGKGESEGVREKARGWDARSPEHRAGRGGRGGVTGMLCCRNGWAGGGRG